MYNYDVYITDGKGKYVAGPYPGSIKDDPKHYSSCAGSGCPSIADGSYDYSFEKGTYSNVRAGRGYNMLRLGTVPTRGPNPKHNGLNVSHGVWVHKGYDRGTYSQGCPTIYHRDWDSFISNFDSSTTGTVSIMTGE